mmetsp:Transcript_19847/g.32019  ORF Transcript_19847/g.32019 Transcript_19847/m.32019 type:complete len:96 (-) Transcript_19847:280-567(-)
MGKQLFRKEARSYELVLNWKWRSPECPFPKPGSIGWFRFIVNHFSQTAASRNCGSVATSVLFLALPRPLELFCLGGNKKKTKIDCWRPYGNCMFS